MSSASHRKAPFCFGRCVSFTPSSRECGNCPHSIDCAKNVLKTLAKISHDLEVSDLERSAQAFLDKNGVKRETVTRSNSKTVKARFAKPAKFNFEVSKSIERLPRKSKMLAKAISRLGINMALDAEQGINRIPQNFRPAYISQVQELLIEGGFTRKQLSDCITKTTSLGEQGVRSATSSCVKALTALNAIKLNGDIYEASDQH